VFGSHNLLTTLVASIHRSILSILGLLLDWKGESRCCAAWIGPGVSKRRQWTGQESSGCSLYVLGLLSGDERCNIVSMSLLGVSRHRSLGPHSARWGRRTRRE